MRTVPVMTRLMSRRSATIWLCAIAFLWITSIACARLESGSDWLWSSRVHPRMALSGVRSSWETIATNSSLARVAASTRERSFWDDS